MVNSSETFLKPEDNPEVSTNEQVLAPEDEMMRQEIDLSLFLIPGGLSKSSPNVKSSFTTENGHSEESDADESQLQLDKWCRENLD